MPPETLSRKGRVMDTNSLISQLDSLVIFAGNFGSADLVLEARNAIVRLSERLEAAEDFIAKHPADPDISEEQCIAYYKWRSIVEKEEQANIHICPSCKQVVNDNDQT